MILIRLTKACTACDWDKSSFDVSSLDEGVYQIYLLTASLNEILAMSTEFYIKGQPSVSPTDLPTITPSILLSLSPSITPSLTPSFENTYSPSRAPSPLRTNAPSFESSFNPSNISSMSPTGLQSNEPTRFNSQLPTNNPSLTLSSFPTNKPTNKPSIQESNSPTIIPTLAISRLPSFRPSDYLTKIPSYNPTMTTSTEPSNIPTKIVSAAPSIIDPNGTYTMVQTNVVITATNVFAGGSSKEESYQELENLTLSFIAALLSDDVVVSDVFVSNLYIVTNADIISLVFIGYAGENIDFEPLVFTSLISNFNAFVQVIADNYLLSSPNGYFKDTEWGILNKHQSTSVNIDAYNAPNRPLNETETDILANLTLHFFGGMNENYLYISSVSIDSSVTTGSHRNLYDRSIALNYNNTLHINLHFEAYISDSTDFPTTLISYIQPKMEDYVSLVKGDSGLGMFDGTYFYVADMVLLADAPSIAPSNILATELTAQNEISSSTLAAIAAAVCFPFNF